MKVQARITGGKVHEVGYRFFLFSKAMELGCERFFARNQFEDNMLEKQEEMIEALEVTRSDLIH